MGLGDGTTRRYLLPSLMYLNLLRLSSLLSPDALMKRTYGLHLGPLCPSTT